MISLLEEIDINLINFCEQNHKRIYYLASYCPLCAKEEQRKGIAMKKQILKLILTNKERTIKKLEAENKRLKLYEDCPVF